MNRATQQLGIAACICSLAACAPALKTAIDRGAKTDIPSIASELRAMKGGQRMDVWIESGECFQAELVSFSGGVVHVAKKWYGASHHRGEGLASDALEYHLTDIVALDTELNGASPALAPRSARGA